MKKPSFHTLRTVYLCFLLAYTVVREVLTLNLLIRPAAVSAGVFAVGFLVILYGMGQGAVVFKDRKTDLLIVFTLMTGVSCLVNFRYAFTDNVKAMGTLLLFFLLCYPAGVDEDRNAREKELRAMMLVLNGVWAVFVLLSVVMYFADVEYVVTRPTGGAVAQGFNTQWQRLWGLFQDPNFAGFVCGACILSCIWTLRRSRKISGRIGAVLQMILQFLYLVLGGSRSALVGLAVGLCVMAFVLIGANGTLRQKTENRKALRYLIPAICCVGVCALMLAGVRAVQIGLPKLKAALPTVSDDAVAAGYETLYRMSGLEILYSGYTGEGDASDIVPDDVEDLRGDTDAPLSRTDLGKSDISNGRFLRWRDTLKVFRHCLVFGTSPRGIVPIAREKEPDTIVAVRGTLSHNGYLDILAFTGILGAPWLYLFLVLAAIALFKKLFRFPEDGTFAFTAGGAALFSVSALFLSDLFFVITVSAVLFWTFLGYSLHTEEETKPGRVYGAVLRVTEKMVKSRKAGK